MPKLPSVLPGEKYGRLTVVEFHSMTNANKRRYLCRCDCGTETVCVGGNLRSGNAKSCGCLQREKAAATAVAAAKVAIEPGARFGLLTVIRKAASGGKARFECVCECGGTLTTLAASLRQGRTQSCGCLRRETTRELGRASRTHGHAGGYPSATYISWSRMWQRCTDESRDDYARYGGRGITVCEEWRDFATFLADMGERPAGRTLDRINNDGAYEKTNCRWSTPVEQAANRRAPDPDSYPRPRGGRQPQGGGG